MVSIAHTTNEWKRITLMPLERFETLEVMLTDDSVHKSVWTGARWLSAGKPISPIAWRVPTCPAAVSEQMKRSALEVLSRLPEKPVLKKMSVPAPAVQPGPNWFKRTRVSLRNLLA
jgi:hypothetical protein